VARTSWRTTSLARSRCTLCPSTSVPWALHSLRPCAERSPRTPPAHAPRAANASARPRPWPSRYNCKMAYTHSVRDDQHAAAQ
jgi:hypothetical protein